MTGRPGDTHELKLMVMHNDFEDTQTLFPLSLYDAILTQCIDNLTHCNMAVAN